MDKNFETDLVIAYETKAMEYHKKEKEILEKLEVEKDKKTFENLEHSLKQVRYGMARLYAEKNIRAKQNFIKMRIEQKNKQAQK